MATIPNSFIAITGIDNSSEGIVFVRHVSAVWKENATGVTKYLRRNGFFRIARNRSIKRRTHYSGPRRSGVVEANIPAN